MGDFVMPSLGADMESGKLIEWRVKPGDEVHRGDVIALVDTDKAEIEVEVFEDGVVQELLVPVSDERVPVGTPLARIGMGTVEPVVVAAPLAPQSNGEVVLTQRRRVSPLARRVAESLGVDLESVEGTGEGGAVTRADVESAAGTSAPPTVATSPPPVAPPPPPAPVPVQSSERQDAMRQAIAALMARSKREVPHYYLGTHVDMSRALGWLEEHNAARPPTERLIYSALATKAVALALREVPELNGFWVDGAFQPSERVHVGLAVSLRAGGLIAPAIHDADAKPLDELMHAMRDLVKRARSGALKASEMSDPTITLTNLGEQGVETVYGVIYPPQVALVGFGAVTERPWAENGMVGARPVAHVTLSADHRASDGHRGGRFLLALDRLLQEPDRL